MDPDPAPGIEDLVGSQLDVLDAQIERQEKAMDVRLSNTSTRAAVLIGASGVLGGTELVTSSGNPWISGISLTLYLGAALCGLFAMRSRMSKQPGLPGLIAEYATAKTISLRRGLLATRLASHERARTVLNGRHGWLVGGFIVLVAAWIASGAGTIYGLVNPQPEAPTIIQIEGAQDAAP
ncbi:hypothetical protein [Microbacterium sp. 18062]|uniref:hypothetical protein n=1 Tax=Microbacterium sp. 18062 TaxID=2681410 RepID=UPI00135B9028|nr:hypothetical protein [Microbacterium sp. 18062]